MITWIQLFIQSETAQAIFLLGMILSVGLILGQIRVFKIQLGISGVLFAGLLFGHFKITLPMALLDFTREFGLILFVYAIGSQVGPSFFSSFKRHGLRFNLYALSFVLTGTLLALLLAKLFHLPVPALAGLLAGAVTNTSSLAAAQQALLESEKFTLMVPQATLSYAVTYPIGLCGVMIGFLVAQKLLKVRLSEEQKSFIETQNDHASQIEVMDLRIDNANLHGLPIRQIPFLKNQSIVISRISHENQVEQADSDTVLRMGDIIRAVGPRHQLQEFKLIVGSESSIAPHLENALMSSRVVVTSKKIAGQSIRDLDIRHVYGVTITRILRSDVELPALSSMELQYADTLVVVGSSEDIESFSKAIGNAPKELQQTELVTVFVGIALGIIAGSLSIPFPGLSSPIRLGLASGPLLISLLLSRVGKIGGLIWYVPPSANAFMRDFGLSLFLSCVGLRSGNQFLSTLFSEEGLTWIGCGFLVTVLPIFLFFILGRVWKKMNYLTLCGLIAGSTTNPASLAFSTELCRSNAQVMAYASVYPLVMILRVIIVQLIIGFSH